MLLKRLSSIVSSFKCLQFFNFVMMVRSIFLVIGFSSSINTKQPIKNMPQPTNYKMNKLIIAPKLQLWRDCGTMQSWDTILTEERSWWLIGPHLHPIMIQWGMLISIPQCNILEVPDTLRQWLSSEKLHWGNVINMPNWVMFNRKYCLLTY